MKKLNLYNLLPQIILMFLLFKPLDSYTHKYLSSLYHHYNFTYNYILSSVIFEEILTFSILVTIFYFFYSIYKRFKDISFFYVIKLLFKILTPVIWIINTFKIGSFLAFIIKIIFKILTPITWIINIFRIGSFLAFVIKIIIKHFFESL